MSFLSKVYARCLVVANDTRPKLLYHQTTRKNAEKIKSDGYISPRIGSIVQNLSEESHAPVVFMSNSRKKLGYYSLWQMEHSSKKKKREDFSANDIARYGALILVDPQVEDNNIYLNRDYNHVLDTKTGELVSYVGDFKVENLPCSIERGDYFSLEPVKIHRVLMGKEYLDYLKRYSQHPVVMKILEKDRGFVPLQ